MSSTFHNIISSMDAKPNILYCDCYYTILVITMRFSEPAFLTPPTSTSNSPLCGRVGVFGEGEGGVGRLVAKNPIEHEIILIDIRTEDDRV